MAIQTVAVIGAGVMGQGIAQACASAGYAVVIFDADSSQVGKALDRIGSALNAAVARGRITSTQKSEAMSRISTARSLDQLRADLFIEAIIEKLAPKRDVLSTIEKVNEKCILATNTSTFPVSQVAEGLKTPERCIGLHFFNPAPVMKLVEVIAGRNSSPDAVSSGIKFVKSLNKTPVIANDSPGFIVNRVARAFYLESLHIAEEGQCTKEAIDSVMRSSGFRMGPFELMDLIGIDTNLAVTNSLYEAFGKPERFRPSRIQEALVKEGRLGVKTSRGFYDYPR